MSLDNSHSFNVQDDGNCVVYNNASKKALWWTNTVGKKLGYLAMQGDGNLVLYDYSINSIWDSKTYGHNGAYVKMQNDGNLVIYPKENDPNKPDGENGPSFWSTGTYGQ
jgi:hypothetical protein